MSILALTAMISCLAIAVALVNFVKIKHMPEGTKDMIGVADVIRQGANTFLMEEYRVIIIVVIILATFMAIFLQMSSAIAFCIGTIVSALPGYLGMQASTLANVRTTNMARVTKKLIAALQVAYRGGSVTGLSVVGFPLIGLVIVAAIYWDQFMNLGYVVNWLGLELERFSSTINSFSFGLSMFALFVRVSGGIYTKASDMGSDLVGKTELNLPEDDRRNPATIADNVGDNVGDTAGLASDLSESFMAGVVSSIVFIINLYIRYQINGLEFSQSFFYKLALYPILFSALGLLASIIGIVYVLIRRNGKDPRRELNIGTWVAAGLTAVFNLAAGFILFKGESVGDLPFRLGIISPCIAAFMGIVGGVLSGKIAEFYTSVDFKPTQEIVDSCKQGPALTVLYGLIAGMRSTQLTGIILAVIVVFAYTIAGMYGISMSAVGMLSFVAISVSVDSYGPISDNAGGIAEMCHLDADVRKITDRLDSEGNTTAAIGKGLCIDSAGIASVCMMLAFIYSFTPLDHIEVDLNIIDPIILAGAFVGSPLPFFFSSILSKTVSKSARNMVDEVRWQFENIAGLREGTVDPDYNRCISIATKGALSEMKNPILISVLVPVVSGFLMGPTFVAGLLVTSILSAVNLATLFGNSGGAWDNAKKAYEEMGLKGTALHFAAVIGDMIGDVFKDTDGPSLDIFIKLMTTSAILFGPLYYQFNLYSYLIGQLPH